MKGYSTLFRSPGLDPHHQIQFSHTKETSFSEEGFYSSVEDAITILSHTNRMDNNALSRKKEMTISNQHISDIQTDE